MATNPRPLTAMLTSGDIATRLAAFDFSVMGQLLPNPDPLLKQLGRDITVYRDLTRDPHVGACIRRRKAAVLALESGVNRGNARARVHSAIEDMLADLDMERVIRQALDACQFGYQPMEVSWWGGNSGLWLSNIQAKPPEWFCFDADAQLRFKARSNPVEGVALPDRKFLLPRQDASYQNPYGTPDLGLCYWPAQFKKGGTRFWLTFVEKYGGGFAIGKLPRGTPENERLAMLQSLEDMLQDAVATIPDDGSVNLLELGAKGASADLYERLVMFCRSEISIVQTGTNQTVEASANKASAHAGMDVADDLRDADASVVCAAVNQAIRWVCDRNYPGSEPPVFEMWDQVARDKLQADRDKSNHDAGAQFTHAYFKRAYGYQDGDLVESPAAPAPVQASRVPAGQPPEAAAFAEAALQAAAADDPTAADVAALSRAAAPAWSALIDQVQALVDAAADLGALQDAMTAAYSHLPTENLVKLMAAAYALADLRGMAAADAES